MKKVLSLKNDVYPLTRLAIPLALMGIVQSATWFFETVFLAHLGPQTLAAGSLVSWSFGTFIAILVGTLGAINILVAHKQGANDQQSISLIARDGLLLALLLALPAFLLLWNLPWFFQLLGQSPAVVLLAKSYLHALAWGLLTELITMAYLEVIMGIGYARTMLTFSVLIVSLNIFWSYVLIFGKWGFPALGIAGAGWGWTLSSWMGMVIVIIYGLTHKTCRNYFRPVFNLKKPSFLLELFRIGFPIGIMFCVEVGFFFALTLVVGLLGSQLQAANQIALQYMGLFMQIMFSIAQAITVRMGHLIGAKAISAAEKAGYISMGIAIITTSLVAILYWFSPSLLISVDFDVNNPENFAIVQEIKKLLAVSALFQIAEGARIVLFGILRSLKDTHFTLLISVISFWGIALPCGYFLATRLHLGGAGLWWGMTLGASFSVLVLGRRFKSKMQHFCQTI